MKDDSFKLSSMYEKGTSPASFYGISTNLMPVLKRFSEMNMKSSNLLDACWKENLLTLSSGNAVELYGDDENLGCIQLSHIFTEAFKLVEEDINIMDVGDPPLNLSQVISYLVIPSLNNTFHVMMNIFTGKISISDSLRYTQLCEAEELHQLNDFFESNIPRKAIELSLKRLKCAKNMKRCGRQSDDILNTAEVLKLGGDFSSIESIKKKVKNILILF